MEEIQSQQQWVLRRLEKFYANPKNIQKVKNILNGDSKLSLRLIDWFATNYAKKYNVAYMINQNYVIVYLSYKNHLKAYSKKMFDPFCRCKRIIFQGFETTIGQLNFFEWIISDGILDYIENNYEKIQKDMEQRTQKHDKTKKRQELSDSATNNISKHHINIKVSFD
jgi:hypothetical protein